MTISKQRSETSLRVIALHALLTSLGTKTVSAIGCAVSLPKSINRG
jgi:hypothetical protein